MSARHLLTEYESYYMQERRAGKDSSTSSHDHPQEKSIAVKADAKHLQEGSRDKSESESEINRDHHHQPDRRR